MTIGPAPVSPCSTAVDMSFLVTGRAADNIFLFQKAPTSPPLLPCPPQRHHRKDHRLQSAHQITIHPSKHAPLLVSASPSMILGHPSSCILQRVFCFSFLPKHRSVAFRPVTFPPLSLRRISCAFSFQKATERKVPDGYSPDFKSLGGQKTTNTLAFSASFLSFSLAG